MSIKILIADDHDVVREGLKTILAARADFQVCGEAATGREAVEKALEMKPDVVVLDFSMPELNGLEATRQIRKALPGTEVLILTMHDSETLAREVLAAGARGFLLKTDTRHHLIAAITALAAHEPFFTHKVSEMLLTHFLDLENRPPAVSNPRERLTLREREVVQLVAEGKASKDIAVKLNISLKTVHAHRTNIMRKLGAHSVGELVLYAVRNNIIQA